jgi:hypothetical protein
MPDTPLALSDAQLDAIMLACRPMQPQERQAFLAALGVLFQGREEIGDGELGRALRQLQREIFRPPTDTETGPGEPHQRRLFAGR